MSAKKPRRIYKLADGSRAVGVTTVLGVLDKPALLPWAYRTGIDAVGAILRGGTVTFADLDELRKSQAWRAQRDAAADAGSRAHDIVASALLKVDEDPRPEGMSDETEAAARACAGRVLGWLEAHGAKVLHAEVPLVSETWRVGGTPDLIAEVGGVEYVVDLKTGKRAYDEVIIQLAAYRYMILENSVATPLHGLVLNAPIDGDEVIPLHIPHAALEQGERMFGALVDVYRARQALTLDKCATDFVAMGV